MTARIFVNGEYAGDTSQPVSSLSPGINEGVLNEVTFTQRGSHDINLYAIKDVDGESPQTYIYPELKPGMSLPLKIAGGLFLGALAFGIGKSLKK